MSSSPLNSAVFNYSVETIETESNALAMELLNMLDIFSDVLDQKRLTSQVPNRRTPLVSG